MDVIAEKKLKVSGFKVTNIGVDPSLLKDKSLAHLIPTRLIPQHCEVTISGVNNAVSNGIRRTIACELPVFALNCEYADITTNDMHIIPEMIQKRLMQIPIDQKIQDIVLELEIVNKGPVAIDIKTKDFRIVKGDRGGRPFNDTLTLLTLAPEKYIKITNIRLTRDYGYIEGHGMQVLAINTVSVCTDQIPINMYASWTAEKDGENKPNTEPVGIPSRLADPQVWKISFNTNGTLDPKEILQMACDNIIERLGVVTDLLPNIENNDDQYILTIHGESHTIGNLLMKTICDMYPDIKMVTYNVMSVERQVTIRVRCDDEIKSVFTNVINRLAEIFRSIKRGL
jgi:DNA-directed RNA polymerase subunit L